jgi:hypothetical protein
VVPRILPQMPTEPDPATPQPVMWALMQMQKFDIGELRRAYGR